MAASEAAICIIYTTGSGFCKDLNGDREKTRGINAIMGHHVAL
jgi:hypothetical protein